MRFPIYAIVLSWNNYTDTQECVESIKSAEPTVSKIVIVDNGSTDGSAERLRRRFSKDLNVCFILNKENMGFARGINVGIKFALEQNADYILLLNQDVIIDKKCVAHLLKAIEKETSVGIVGPRIFYYSDTKRVWHDGGYFNFLKMGPYIPNKNRLVNENEDTDKVKYVTFLTGCVMLVRREVFEKVGLFDEDFFFYGEDADLCLRTLRTGFKILFVPSAKAWHKIAPSKVTPFVMYHRAISDILVVRKNFPIHYFFYRLLIHLLIYTPYRFTQSIKSPKPVSSMLSWLSGTLNGIVKSIKVRSEVVK